MKQLFVPLLLIFAVWLPQSLKEELALVFRQAPTFYDVGLMIRDAFKREDVDGVKFMDSATDLLEYLDDVGLTDKRRTENEWNV